jgi:hypothetical protein
MISEALGRVINTQAPASGVWFSLRDCAGITFLGFEVDGATTYTLAFATDSGGGTTSTPAVIDHYYGKSADVQNGVWHRTAQTLSNVVNAADGTEDHVAIEVLDTMAPVVNGVRYPWVRLTADTANPTTTATVTAVFHDLAMQRAPQNLRSVTA